MSPLSTYQPLRWSSTFIFSFDFSLYFKINWGWFANKNCDIDRWRLLADMIILVGNMQTPSPTVGLLPPQFISNVKLVYINMFVNLFVGLLTVSQQYYSPTHAFILNNFNKYPKVSARTTFCVNKNITEAESDIFSGCFVQCRDVSGDHLHRGRHHVSRSDVDLAQPQRWRSHSFAVIHSSQPLSLVPKPHHHSRTWQSIREDCTQTDAMGFVSCWRYSKHLQLFLWSVNCAENAVMSQLALY